MDFKLIIVIFLKFLIFVSGSHCACSLWVLASHRLQAFLCELLDILSYSFELASLLGTLKIHLSILRFHSNEEVEVVVRECLKMREPDSSRDGTIKLAHIVV
jgi:hypothetical protein